MYLFRIGNEAFSGCTSLTKIPIFQSIFSEGMRVGKCTYESCKGIKLVNVSGMDDTAYMVRCVIKSNGVLSKLNADLTFDTVTKVMIF